MKYIDIHSHIFPDNIAGKVVHELESYYGTPWDGTGEQRDLLESLNAVPVDRSVIFSSATKPQQVESINNYIAGLVKQFPDRFIGFGTMHQDYANYKDELRRIRELGLRGLKFHPDFQRFHVDDPRMMKIYEEAGDSLVLLFHIGDRNTDFSSPYRLARVLRDLPGLKIVAAHMGGYSEWEQAWEHLVGKDVWFDTSSTMPMLPPEEARRMALAHGTDRILFGSDYPAAHHRKAIAQTLDIGLSEEDNEKVFYKNAEKLLGITLP